MSTAYNPEGCRRYLEEFAGELMVTRALKDQEDIGWTHFLQGRISCKWQQIQFHSTYSASPDTWAKQIVMDLLQLGCALWKQRNRLVHGNGGEISKLAVQHIQQVITVIYTEIFPQVNPEHNWMFTSTLEKKLKENYSTQVAWLDGIKRLYPEQYSAVVQSVRQQTVFNKELEYVKRTCRIPHDSLQ